MLERFATNMQKEQNNQFHMDNPRTSIRAVKTAAYTTYSVEDFYYDSPVGAGTAIAELTVFEEVFEESDSLVNLTLSWRPNDTEAQRDEWRVSYDHHLETIGRSLLEYLNGFCPIPDQMWQTIQSLDLPDSLRNAINSGD